MRLQIPGCTEPEEHGGHSDHIHDGRMHLLHELASRIPSVTQNAHHSSSASSSKEMKFTKDIADLIACWACRVEESNDFIIGILQLKV